MSGSQPFFHQVSNGLAVVVSLVKVSFPLPSSYSLDSYPFLGLEICFFGSCDMAEREAPQISWAPLGTLALDLGRRLWSTTRASRMWYISLREKHREILGSSTSVTPSCTSANPTFLESPVVCAAVILRLIKWANQTPLELIHGSKCHPFLSLGERRFQTAYGKWMPFRSNTVPGNNKGKARCSLEVNTLCCTWADVYMAVLPHPLKGSCAGLARRLPQGVTLCHRQQVNSGW